MHFHKRLEKDECLKLNWRVGNKLPSTHTQSSPFLPSFRLFQGREKRKNSLTLKAQFQLQGLVRNHPSCSTAGQVALRLQREARVMNSPRIIQIPAGNSPATAAGEPSPLHGSYGRRLLRAADSWWWNNPGPGALLDELQEQVSQHSICSSNERGAPSREIKLQDGCRQRHRCSDSAEHCPDAQSNA